MLHIMNYITDLAGRKAALARIVPNVPSSGGRWGKKLDWTKYFEANPFDAPLLGYDVRETKPELWNRNNVLARALLNTGKIHQNGQTNGLKGTPSGLLVDPEQRKALLTQIMPLVPMNNGKGGDGQLAWKAYFDAHPEHSTALGYDIRKTRPRPWAANLRMSQNPEYTSLKGRGPISSPEAIAEGVAELEAKADAIKHQQLRDEIKELRERVRELETLNSNCRSELDGAKDIVFELTMQIRELKKG